MPRRNIIRFDHCDLVCEGPTRFHQFRRRVAAAVNIPLDEMDGYFGRTSWTGYRDPITLFLRAGDLAEAIDAGWCRVVASRLWHIARPWPAEDPDRILALTLVRGLRRSATLEEPFRFGSLW